MREKFTITQAAGRLGVSRRTLYNWLKRENESARKVRVTVEGKERIGRESWLTQRQLETLAQRYGRELDKNPTLEALQARVESQDAMIEEHETRIAALERALARARMPYSGPQQAIQPKEGEDTPAPAKAALEPLQSRTGAFSEGGLSKADAARLIAARHGADFGTVRGWPWPPEALASAEAAEAWAIDYVAARPPHKRPTGWH